MSFEQPPQFKQTPEMKPEETKEIFETTEKEIKLRDTIEKWVDKSGSGIQERAEHFGLGKQAVEEVKENLGRSFQKDLLTITTDDGIKELKEASSKTVNNLIEQEDKTGLKNSLDQLSKKDILDLLNRKLEGGVSLEEKKILDIFSYVEKGEKLGTHDPRSGEIEVSLLNAKNLKEYTGTLHHEFTHKALSGLMPEAVKEKMISIGVTGALEKSFGEEQIKKDKTPTEKTQGLFFNTLSAIDESLAHRVGKYYTEEHEPQYGAYKEKIHPGIFERVYSQIDFVATGKSIADFDKFAAHIYSFFVNKWDKDLSQKDLEKIIVSTVGEINKFKKK